MTQLLASSPPALATSPEVDATALCRSVIEHNSKSFALASKLLPPTTRAAARVVYAWCRRADDAVDKPKSVTEARDALARLERELESLYSGNVQPDPVLEAFRHVVVQHAIPIDYPAELLAGMRMDVEGYRYRTLDDLMLYSFRVASTVGLMMCHVLGIERTQALRNAAHLGIAMQITNICRDVEEDWHLGRLYLPERLLADVGALALLEHRGHAFPLEHRHRVGCAVRSLLTIAEVYYRSGASGLRDLDFRSAFSVQTAMLVYREIGREIAGSDYDVLHGRAVVSTSRKLWLVAVAGISMLVDAPRRLLHRRTRASLTHAVSFPHDVLPV